MNCTGPATDWRELAEPIVADLFERGAARPDPFSLGLDTAQDGALAGADGTPSRTLFTLGPTRRGTLWVTTACPEIRAQAAALAERLLA